MEDHICTKECTERYLNKCPLLQDKFNGIITNLEEMPEDFAQTVEENFLDLLL